MWFKERIKIRHAFYVETPKTVETPGKKFHLIWVSDIWEDNFGVKQIRLVNEKNEVVYNWPLSKLKYDRAPTYDRKAFQEEKSRYK